jgi:hypothetical protein
MGIPAYIPIDVTTSKPFKAVQSRLAIPIDISSRGMQKYMYMIQFLSQKSCPYFP